MTMVLELRNHNEQSIAEAPRNLVLVDRAAAVTDVIEFCLNNRVRRVLLYSENLAAEFFDLKTGMAGTMLQKFRQYRLRLAIVLDPDLSLSDRFRELAAEENKAPYVRFARTAEEARDWLVTS